MKETLHRIFDQSKARAQEPMDKEMGDI